MATDREAFRADSQSALRNCDPRIWQALSRTSDRGKGRAMRFPLVARRIILAPVLGLALALAVSSCSSSGLVVLGQLGRRGADHRELGEVLQLQHAALAAGRPAAERALVLLGHRF